MANVAMYVSDLNPDAKALQGQNVIDHAGDSSLAQGLSVELAAFTTANADLVAKNAALKAARTDCKAKLLERNASLASWVPAYTALGAAVQKLSGGDAALIASTGYNVRAPKSPTQRLDAPANVRVETNGTPGVTMLSCEPLVGAVSYLVETSADPITEDSWEQVATPTKASCEVEGAEPGKKRWYRWAGVNALGQGPWSEPVARPVV